MSGAILTDLSKDYLPHDIFIAKLYVYGFHMIALEFIYDYLRNRKQRAKVDNACNSWQNTTWNSTRIDFKAAII